MPVSMGDEAASALTQVILEKTDLGRGCPRCGEKSFAGNRHPIALPHVGTGWDTYSDEAQLYFEVSCDNCGSSFFFSLDLMEEVEVRKGATGLSFQVDPN
jgi:predicted nucleic-acid-binding Zn-ribbon protein